MTIEQKKERTLKCYKCNTMNKINIQYKKEFWKCINCGTTNTCTHYVDSVYGISKRDSLLLSKLGKRRYQEK